MVRHSWKTHKHLLRFQWNSWCNLHNDNGNVCDHIDEFLGEIYFRKGTFSQSGGIILFTSTNHLWKAPVMEIHCHLCKPFLKNNACLKKKLCFLCLICSKLSQKICEFWLHIIFSCTFFCVFGFQYRRSKKVMNKPKRTFFTEFFGVKKKI